MRKIALMMLCLTLLTACSSVPAQVVKPEYVYQQIPSLPAAPEMYPVKWQRQGSGYLLDEQNAKSLLKNWELQRGYSVDLRTILEGLKRETK